MKTKTVVTLALIATVYALFINWMSLSGINAGEMTSVGWYNEYGEHRKISIYPTYVWLFLPFTICFYLFGTLFLSKVIALVNKWLGRTAFVLWCINVVVILLNEIFNIYVVSRFSGDEMYCSLEEYWRTGGSSEYPLVWFMLSSDMAFYRVRHFGYLLSLLAFVLVFAWLIKKAKVWGITGTMAMLVLLVIFFFPLPYASCINNLCWVVLFAVTLWKLYQSPRKPFLLS